MKSSAWFSNKSNQSVLRDIPRVNTIVRSGPSTDGTKHTQISKKSHFIVGESIVGKEDIVVG